MASLSEQSRVRELFDNMTLGVVRSLGKFETNIFKCIIIRTRMVILVLAANTKTTTVESSATSRNLETQNGGQKIASDKEFSQRFLVKVDFVVEKKPGVTDVRLLDRQPAEKHIIFTWEQVRHFTVFDNQ